MEIQGKIGRKMQAGNVCSKISQIIRFFEFVRLKTRLSSNLMRQPWGGLAVGQIMIVRAVVGRAMWWRQRPGGQQGSGIRQVVCSI